MTHLTRKVAIETKCFECIVDPGSAGTQREQVAACINGGCPLFTFRPLPRHCMKGGEVDREAIAAVRAKLDRINRERGMR